MREAGSVEVRAELRRRAVISSSILPLELKSMLWRRLDQGEVSAREYGQAQAALSVDRQDWLLLDVGPDLLRRAEEMAERLHVRSLDAIHLASAVLLAADWPDRLPFLTADLRQARAAEAVGLAVLRFG
ncbi:MAG TPA: type II toxin-antitoxin system VapC family toxin [Terriglobales bacterium]